MKLLIVDHDAVALAFALRCVRAGHAVRWFIKPKPSNNRDVGEGFKGIEKIDNWVGSVKWADLIWCSSNDDYLPKLDAVRAGGAKFFGPSEKSAALEIKRSEGMKFLEKHNIDVPEYQQFKSLSDAEAHVRKTEKRFVFKTLGDNEDKSLSYVSKTPADMVARLQRWQKLNMNPKGPVMLQEFIPGIEFAVSGWMGSDGFLAPLNENFENKKLMSGDCGPHCGESGTVMKYVQSSALAEAVLYPLEDGLRRLGHLGGVDVNCIIDEKGKAWPLEFTCFDDQTDILTSNGWISIKDVKIGMSIATMDPKTDELQYKPCKDVIARSYVGEMLHFGGTHSAPEFMVTPDHQMWVSPRKDASYRFVAARDLNGLCEVKRGIRTWTGRQEAAFTLPGYIEKHALGRHHKTIELVHNAIDMSMEVWMGFLGLLLSEGSVSEYIVSIAQKKHRHHKIWQYLKDFPITPREQISGAFQIHSRQLCVYLKGLGFEKQPVRRIPRQFMDLAPNYLNILLDALIAGDGSVHRRNGQRTYFSSSFGLASDVQELMLKCGYPARIVESKVAGTVMRVGEGKAYVRNHNVYRVCERRERPTGYLDRRMLKRVHYSGKVYCCSVPPHHLIYVRRNGNAAWCGNCRPGWPALNIMLAEHKGDPAQWMLDACNGKDTLEVSPQVACGVVVAIPDYPYSNKALSERSDIPIYGVTDKNRAHIAPQSVKLAKHPVMQGGKVMEKEIWSSTDDYLFVVTGMGKTVRRACDRAYATLRELHVPDMIYRDDIGEKLEKSLPELHKLGYAAEFEYD